MLNYKKIGKRIYNLGNPREYRRYLVFRIRCMIYSGRMKRLENYFASSDLLTKISDICPFVYEQPTRSFFFYRSSFNDRVTLIEHHMTYLAEHLKENVFIDLYTYKEKIIWKSSDEGEKLYIKIWYHPGQRKEGLLSVVLSGAECGDLYQMMFWIAPNGNGDWALWIGAMQGPNMVNARNVIKKVTKRCHAYRTKNLILHATQEVAKSLGLKRIYAVTNYGYYAMNHVRCDRKLKTSFSDFWTEAGGIPCEDKRFYELPMTEYRKRMEEIPSRKRANYRRRYVFLDELDSSIRDSIKKMLKS